MKNQVFRIDSDGFNGAWHKKPDDPADRVPVCVRVDGVDHADHREVKR